MKKLFLLFTFACLPLTTLVSCHTSHQTVAKKSTRPKFIENVYIAPHNKNNTTNNAVDRRTLPGRSKTNGNNRNQPIANKQGHTASSQEITLPAGHTNKISPPAVVRKKYSELLGVRPNEITNFSLYQFIDKWYGTDYRLGGLDKHGIDCSAFAQRLYGEVYGVDLLRTATEQFSNCRRIKASRDAEEGDLVFFRIRSKHISHVGVYLANDYFVHASSSGGVMISNLNEEYWHKYYAGCGRVPKS